MSRSLPELKCPAYPSRGIVIREADDLDLITMSGCELQRIEVLSEVVAKKRTVASAAAVLAVGVPGRSRRLLTAFRDSGGPALIHKSSRPRFEQPPHLRCIREYAMASWSGPSTPTSVRL